MSTRLENRKFVARSGIKSEHPVDASSVAHQVVTATTNGTTAVNVFGSKGAPFNLTITGIFGIAKDTTAGNIILKNGASTVASFAKGATALAVVGEDGSLASTSVGAGATVTIESSSAGNAQVFITYTVD